MKNKESILDCGHPPSPHNPLTTGYGSRDGKKSCYDCCTKDDMQEIRESAFGNKVSHYISQDGHSVTNWPGHGLGRVIYWGKLHNFSGERHHIQVKMIDGSLWSGIGAKGMWTTLAKVKTHR